MKISDVQYLEKMSFSLFKHVWKNSVYAVANEYWIALAPEQRTLLLISAARSEGCRLSVAPMLRGFLIRLEMQPANDGILFQ